MRRRRSHVPGSILSAAVSQHHRVTVPRWTQVTAVDTNGAGDTFATAYMLALASRSSRPGTVANWAAAQTVSQPQARNL